MSSLQVKCRPESRAGTGPPFSARSDQVIDARKGKKRLVEDLNAMVAAPKRRLLKKGEKISAGNGVVIPTKRTSPEGFPTVAIEFDEQDAIPSSQASVSVGDRKQLKGAATDFEKGECAENPLDSSMGEGDFIHRETPLMDGNDVSETDGCKSSGAGKGEQTKDELAREDKDGSVPLSKAEFSTEKNLEQDKKEEAGWASELLRDIESSDFGSDEDMECLAWDDEGEEEEEGRVEYAGGRTTGNVSVDKKNSETVRPYIHQNREPHSALICSGKNCLTTHHLQTLYPSLEDLPLGIWFCPACLQKRENKGPHVVCGVVDSVWGARRVLKTGKSNATVRWVKATHGHTIFGAHQNGWLKSGKDLEGPISSKGNELKDGEDSGTEETETALGTESGLGRRSDGGNNVEHGRIETDDTHLPLAIEDDEVEDVATEDVPFIATVDILEESFFSDGVDEEATNGNKIGKAVTTVEGHKKFRKRARNGNHKGKSKRKKGRLGVFTNGQSPMNGRMLRQVSMSNSEKTEVEVEYLVKWEGMAHYYNTWMTEEWLERHCQNKMEAFKKRPRKWKKQWMRPEKLVAWRVSMPPVRPGQGRGRGIGWGTQNAKGKEWLVKWKGLGYRYCTWEPAFPGVLDTQEGRNLCSAFLKAEEDSGRNSARKEEVEKRRSDMILQPECFSGKLRPHQLEGWSWLLKCWRLRKIVVFSDEAGLGKTTTTLAFLASLFEVFEITKPILVVASPIKAAHWMNEISLWCPHLKTVALKGGKENRELIKRWECHLDQSPMRVQVLVTSFDHFLMETDFLQLFEWEMVVLDWDHQSIRESEKMQNKTFFDLLSQMQIAFRLVVSRTNVQDEGEDVVSLFHYVASVKDSGDVSKEEKYFLEENVLQRQKEDVIPLLPKMMEKIVPVDMGTLQTRLYRTLLGRYFMLLSSGKWEDESGVTLGHIVRQLRKCCDHPYLMEKRGGKRRDPSTHGDKGGKKDNHFIFSSGKLKLLNKMLTDIPSTRKPVVILSSVPAMLDLLENYFRRNNSIFGGTLVKVVKSCSGPYCQNFNDMVNNNINEGRKEKFSALFLPTKACSLGLDLTSFQTAIFIDSSWNPQRDIEALARAFPNPKEKELMVYRLFTSLSLEERVLALASSLEEPNSVENALRFYGKQTEESVAICQDLLQWGLPSYIRTKLHEGTRVSPPSTGYKLQEDRRDSTDERDAGKQIKGGSSVKKDGEKKNKFAPRKYRYLPEQVKELWAPEGREGKEQAVFEDLQPFRRLFPDEKFSREEPREFWQWLAEEKEREEQEKVRNLKDGSDGGLEKDREPRVMDEENVERLKFLPLAAITSRDQKFENENDGKILEEGKMASLDRLANIATMVKERDFNKVEIEGKTNKFEGRMPGIELEEGGEIGKDGSEGKVRAEERETDEGTRSTSLQMKRKRSIKDVNTVRISDMFNEGEKGLHREMSDILEQERVFRHSSVERVYVDQSDLVKVGTPLEDIKIGTEDKSGLSISIVDRRLSPFKSKSNSFNRGEGQERSPQEKNSPISDTNKKKWMEKMPKLHAKSGRLVKKICQILNLPENVEELGNKLVMGVLNWSKGSAQGLPAIALAMCWQAAADLHYNLDHQSSHELVKDVLQLKLATGTIETTQATLMKRCFSRRIVSPVQANQTVLTSNLRIQSSKEKLSENSTEKDKVPVAVTMEGEDEKCVETSPKKLLEGKRNFENSIIPANKNIIDQNSQAPSTTEIILLKGPENLVVEKADALKCSPPSPPPSLSLKDGKQEAEIMFSDVEIGQLRRIPESIALQEELLVNCTEEKSPTKGTEEILIKDSERKGLIEETEEENPIKRTEGKSLMKGTMEESFMEGTEDKVEQNRNTAVAEEVVGDVQKQGNVLTKQDGNESKKGLLSGVCQFDNTGQAQNGSESGKTGDLKDGETENEEAVEKKMSVDNQNLVENQKSEVNQKTVDSQIPVKRQKTVEVQKAVDYQKSEENHKLVESQIPVENQKAQCEKSKKNQKAEEYQNLKEDQKTIEDQKTVESQTKEENQKAGEYQRLEEKQKTVENQKPVENQDPVGCQKSKEDQKTVEGQILVENEKLVEIQKAVDGQVESAAVEAEKTVCLKELDSVDFNLQRDLKRLNIVVVVEKESGETRENLTCGSNLISVETGRIVQIEKDYELETRKLEENVESVATVSLPQPTIVEGVQECESLSGIKLLEESTEKETDKGEGGNTREGEENRVVVMNVVEYPHGESETGKVANTEVRNGVLKNNPVEEKTVEAVCSQEHNGMILQELIKAVTTCQEPEGKVHEEARVRGEAKVQEIEKELGVQAPVRIQEERRQDGETLQEDKTRMQEEETKQEEARIQDVRIQEERIEEAGRIQEELNGCKNRQQQEVIQLMTYCKASMNRHCSLSHKTREGKDEVEKYEGSRRKLVAEQELLRAQMREAHKIQQEQVRVLGSCNIKNSVRVIETAKKMLVDVTKWVMGAEECLKARQKNDQENSRSREFHKNVKRAVQESVGRPLIRREKTSIHPTGVLLQRTTEIESRINTNVNEVQMPQVTLVHEILPAMRAILEVQSPVQSLPSEVATLGSREEENGATSLFPGIAEEPGTENNDVLSVGGCQPGQERGEMNEGLTVPSINSLSGGQPSLLVHNTAVTTVTPQISGADTSLLPRNVQIETPEVNLIPATCPPSSLTPSPPPSLSPLLGGQNEGFVPDLGGSTENRVQIISQNGGTGGGGQERERGPGRESGQEQERDQERERSEERERGSRASGGRSWRVPPPRQAIMPQFLQHVHQVLRVQNLDPLVVEEMLVKEQQRIAEGALKQEIERERVQRFTEKDQTIRSARSEITELDKQILELQRQKEEREQKIISAEQKFTQWQKGSEEDILSLRREYDELIQGLGQQRALAELVRTKYPVGRTRPTGNNVRPPSEIGGGRGAAAQQRPTQLRPFPTEPSGSMSLGDSRTQINPLPSQMHPQQNGSHQNQIQMQNQIHSGMPSPTTQQRPPSQLQQASRLSQPVHLSFNVEEQTQQSSQPRANWSPLPPNPNNPNSNSNSNPCSRSHSPSPLSGPSNPPLYPPPSLGSLLTNSWRGGRSFPHPLPQMSNLSSGLAGGYPNMSLQQGHRILGPTNLNFVSGQGSPPVIRPRNRGSTNSPLIINSINNPSQQIAANTASMAPYNFTRTASGGENRSPSESSISEQNRDASPGSSVQNLDPLGPSRTPVINLDSDEE